MAGHAGVLLHSTHLRSCCVLDDERKLTGIVTEFDVETVLMRDEPEERTVGDIMTKNVITCTPDQSSWENSAASPWMETWKSCAPGQLSLSAVTVLG